MRYLTRVVAFAILLSFASSAPTTQMRRSRRHGLLQDFPISITTTPWNNPCDITNNTVAGFIAHPRIARPWKGLRQEIPNYIIRLGTYDYAINTDDISQWFWEFNATYQFLARINGSSSKIQLRKRHLETQVYVGAFQYLSWKQLNHPKKGIDRTNKLIALKNLLLLSKNLLCEIETAINNTGMKMPMMLSREEMNSRLTFHNNGKKLSFDPSQIDEVDEIDTKFAKVRFTEYLHALQQMLSNRRGKHHQHVKNTQPRKNLPSNADDKAVHAINVPKGNRRKSMNRKNIQRTNISKAINQTEATHITHSLRNHQVDSDISATKRLSHRPMHRKRPGLGKKQKKVQNQSRGVAGVGSIAIKQFRRNHRRSTTTSLPIVLSSTSTSTTVAPHT